MLHPYQMKNLSDQGAYNEIISIYQSSEEWKSFTEWDWVYVMNAFYKTSRHDECLQLYKEFHKLYPDSARLDDKMCWSLYHVHLKGVTVTEENADEYRRRVDFILQHCGASQYSPRWFVTKLIVKAIKDGKYGQQVDYAAILGYLNQIDPATLSTAENPYVIDGKQVRLASDQESWYADKCSAELKTGQYDSCIKTADQAVRSLHSFHSNNDSWFPYRKAKARMALGQSELAGKEVQAILDRGFSHWCFYQILFEVARDLGNGTDALLQGCKCALADPSHEMRVSFYEEFAVFLDQNEHGREALLHRQLVILLRNEKGWALRERHTVWQIPKEISSMDKKSVLQELNAFWRKVKDSSRTFYTGTIERLLPSGQDGFISGSCEHYYFRMNDIRKGRSSAKEGSAVRFALENRLDRKKNVVKPAAIDIEVM